jgi:hypothetical protein
LQLFGVSSLYVQRAGLDAAIGNVDPSTAGASALFIACPFASGNSPFFEIAFVLVRLDHVASVIVNADDSIM